MVRGCGMCMWRRCGRSPAMRMPMAPRPMCARTKFIFCILESCLGRAGCSSEECCPDPGVRAVRVGLRDRRGRCTLHRGLQAVGIKLCTPRNTKECLLVELRRHAQPEASLYTDRAAPPSPEHPPSSRLTWFQVPLAAPAQGAAWRPATRGQHTVGTGHVSRPGSTSLARPRNIAIAI